MLIARMYAYFQTRFCRLAAEKIFFTNSDKITRFVCVCVYLLHILIAVIGPMEARCGNMEWTGLAQNRDRMRVLVNAVMNLRVP
jgi:hypothetical protein